MRPSPRQDPAEPHSCPRTDGVVLPPARLQIAMAVRPMGSGEVLGGGSAYAWSIHRESVGLGGAVEREGDKSSDWGWLTERGAWVKSFTAPGHKTS